MAFDQSTRNRLQKFVSNARAILSEEFTRQLQATYGLDPKQGTVATIDSLTHLDNRQRQTAHLLRETLAHYMATTPGKGEKDRTKQVLDRIVREQAFTVLNRLAALRMAEARGFLLESIAKAHSSKGFQLYRQLSGTAHGETGDAYRNYLFSLFDEFSLDLAVLFDRHSAQGRLFPRESALLELLAEINHVDIEHLWAEDETIGWIYQYFNSQEERKKMRAESQAPRNSRELAVRNQFFTPRYVVEFLTDNTLGRIWYEMTQGNTALVDSCRYLVRRPTEIFLKPGETAPKTEASDSEALSQEELLKQPVYIPHRPLKDPRTIRMLDPACGSMHFGLYAFDLFERIYLEAWQLEQQLGPDAFIREAGQQALQSTYKSLEAFKQQIPKLIIEHNIHGVDIDPRAVQIAGLSLWQRAQRAWHLQGIKPQQRPTIVKSNIVCAEPMPGEKALLQEFTSKLNPPVLGQLLEVFFDKMQLAGEAGTLLKIEEEIQTAIHEAREQWLKQSGSNSVGDLFQAELEAATPQAKLGFDLRGIDDETFWGDAEQRILQALSDYADQAESNADQKRLFAEDAAKGFAFIDLCSKRFDVVLMNPPFGSPTIKKEISSYISSSANNNLYAAFVEIGHFRLQERGFVGAITDRTFMLLPTYETFRTTLLDQGLVGVLDLNWGVLDDAQVATCAYISTKTCFEIDTWFIDAREESNKEAFACNAACNPFLTSIISSNTLHNIPTKPLSYWAPEKVRLAFTTYESLEPSLAIVRKGLSPGDSERFVKLRSEIPQDQIGLNKNWAPYANGGSFSPYFRSIKEVVKWSDSGREIKSFYKPDGKPRFVVRSESLYGNEGITFGKRGEVLNLQNLDDGCVFSNEGYIIKLNDNVSKYSVLGYLNSSVSRYMVNMIAGLHKEVGAVKKIPIPEAVGSDKFIETSVIELILNGTELNQSEILAQSLLKPLLYSEKKMSLVELIHITASTRKAAVQDFLFTAGKIDNYCFSMLNIEKEIAYNIKSEIETISPVWKPDLSLSEKDIALEVISSCIGCAFGWFSCDAVETPRPLYEGDDLCLVTEGILNRIFDDNESSRLILFDLISDTLGNYLNKSSGFFDYHLAIFSKASRKAPIYWPLQTPSGSYTLWVYYHRLNEQTLYTCVNDFVEPKLSQVEQDLNSLRSKSARSSQEEKELEKLSDLASELRDFRDELLRLAKFWKPNLNDGVQITAAPLWKLFQHKAWQKKLKETWESLEKGDYDWAHLACSIWPERVLRKCHQDRSLAIAHDVEQHFWHEVEVPVKRGKKLTGSTKLEWQPKDLSEAELNTLVQKLVAEVK